MSVSDKLHMSIPMELAEKLAAIEAREDRPRTRIVRRALEDYIKKYSEEHPDFKAGTTKPRFREGLKTDVVILGGVKREVIVDGATWRLPTEKDYEGYQEPVGE